MNHIALTGRLVRDPEIRHSKAGKIVYTFSLAVRRAMYLPDEQNTDFFECVSFGTTAEKLSKCDLKKGMLMLVEGEIRIESYTNRNGEKRNSTKAIVTKFELLDYKRPSVPQIPAESQTDDGVIPDYDDEDEVPFV